MPDYDFRSLSPHDFELLSRDLLQRSLSLRLESFTTGRDSGIDFRHSAGDNNLIVQSKHYAESGFTALRRSLTLERDKLKLIDPSRYIVTTSVGLTPGHKATLLQILKPYCHGTSDILGKDDLNNLLTQHADIERAHFKLWLTSSAVLERVLHAGIFSDSDAHLERIRLRLSRYVPNASLERAQEILGKSHFCIVAGIPGIGKTTLAEVLLADLVERHGYAVFRIAHDLSELRPIKNAKSKQVFYFDDFLGKTSLNKLQKNEDQRLVELMAEVAENPNWRFVLTTREYILNIAKQQYESFANPPVNFRMCVINLSDYTRKVRAKILYNHIYFSDLPKEYKLALLEDSGYEKILLHRNYNPRVIDYMTQSTHALGVTSSLYLQEFVDSLHNPARIWDHAFRYQISEAARSFLFVLTTLPDEMTLDNLEKAFWTFYQYRQKRFGFPTAPGDWVHALKELDGNFIKTEKVGDEVVISFHNPSIRDYMEKFLEASDSDILDLIRAASFYEQYTTLWTGHLGQRYRAIVRERVEFARMLSSNLWGPSARTIRRVNHQGEAVGLTSHSPSNENRVHFLIKVIDELKLTGGSQIIESVLNQMSALWQKGSADRQDLIHLLASLTKRGIKKNDVAFTSARDCLLLDPQTDAEYRAAADFYQTYPEAVPDEKRDALKESFKAFASDHPANSDDDPDWIRDAVADIQYVGQRIGIDVEEYTQRLLERADEIESERANESEPDYDERGWEGADSDIDDVQSMFEGLRSDLQAP